MYNPFHQKNFLAMEINVTKNGHANTKCNTNKCYYSDCWNIALQRNRIIHHFRAMAMLDQEFVSLFSKLFDNNGIMQPGYMIE